MSKNRKRKAITVDRTIVEKMVGEVLELGFKNPSDLVIFFDSFLKKIHESTKQKIGGDSPSVPKNIAALIFILGNESERGCALAAAAYLEEELGSLLKGYFVVDKKFIDEIFRPFGVLDSFSSRIIMSYCLGLISNIARRDLYLIKKIRNRFAHSAENISFNDTDIKSICNELYHDVYKEKLTPRMKFIRVVGGVATEIYSSMASTKRCAKRPDMNVEKFFNKEQREMYLNIINTYIKRKLAELAVKET